MTRQGEKVLGRALWAAYAVLAVAGLGLLAEALFLPRPRSPIVLKRPPIEEATLLRALPAAKEGLVERRFTRRVVAAAAPSSPGKAPSVSLDQLIRLTGILDFGGKQPALAVIEAAGESKAYKAGDKVGETGVLVRDIKDFVIVEFEKRRFKVTFAGIQELSANAVGKD